MSCRKASTQTRVKNIARIRKLLAAPYPDRCHQGCQRQARRAKGARASLSLLWQQHAHHRDFLALATAEAPSLAKGQDRHLMMPPPVLDTHSRTHRLCRLLPDSAAACLATPDCCAITPKRHKISSLKTPTARSYFNLPSAYAAKRALLPLRVNRRT